MAARFRETLRGRSGRILQIATVYGILNPHLRLDIDLFGQKYTFGPGNPAWEKWQPSDAGSPHWYRPLDRFERLLGAFITEDERTGRDRMVREIIPRFTGLSGTAKQRKVLESAGLSRTPLSGLVNGSGLNHELTAGLLEAMRAEAKPIQPERLGVIGKDHVGAVFENLGADPNTFKYKRFAGEVNGLPTLAEVAFAAARDQAITEEDDVGRQLFLGLNWSPCLRDPFRQLGDSYSGMEGLLQEQRADYSEPVLLMLHLACARLEFTDRGKSAVVLSGELGTILTNLIVDVTNDWRKLRDKEDRDATRRFRRRELLARQSKTKATTLKDAVFSCAQEAARRASGDGQYEFPERNYFYALRKLIQAVTDKELKSQTFKSILTAYEREHGLIPGLYRDPRGFLIEPHTGKVVPLGTREVDAYELPELLYDKIVYIEKKGFWPILKAAHLAERYDAAIVCAEGYAVRAAKALLSAAQDKRQMIVVVFHDADPYGYNIARTLREATATCPHNSIEVIDLGLGVEEAIRMGLPTETFYRKKAIPKKLVLTEFERKKFTGTPVFIKGKRVWKAERVELNALAADPDRFIAWMRKKLDAAGLRRKLVPPARKAQAEAKRRLTEALNVRVADELDRLLRVTETRDRLVRRLAKKFTVETIPERLAKWAKKLEPVPWTAEVERLVDARLAKQAARITQAVEGAVEKSRRGGRAA